MADSGDTKGGPRGVPGKEEGIGLSLQSWYSMVSGWEDSGNREVGKGGEWGKGETGTERAAAG